MAAFSKPIVGNCLANLSTLSLSSAISGGTLVSRYALKSFSLGPCFFLRSWVICTPLNTTIEHSWQPRPSLQTQTKPQWGKAQIIESRSAHGAQGCCYMPQDTDLLRSLQTRMKQVKSKTTNISASKGETQAYASSQAALGKYFIWNRQHV